MLDQSYPKTQKWRNRERKPDVSNHIYSFLRRTIREKGQRIDGGCWKISEIVSKNSKLRQAEIAQRVFGTRFRKKLLTAQSRIDKARLKDQGSTEPNSIEGRKRNLPSIRPLRWTKRRKGIKIEQILVPFAFKSCLSRICHSKIFHVLPIFA